MSENIVNLSDANFNTEVLQSDAPVIVDFWAPWCGPCRQIAPVLDGVAERRAGGVKIAKVNVDDEPSLAGSFGIRGIPTLIAFRDGHKVDEMVGFGGAATLEAWVDGIVGEAADTGA